MPERETTFFVPRHSKKTKSETEGSNVSGEFYPGIRPEGEEIVRERTRTEIKDLIEQAPADAVVIFGGASELARTKSSTRISASELKNIFEQSEDVIILDEAAIGQLTETQEKNNRRKALQEFVAENEGKKIIIINPLAIRELSLVESQASKGREAGKPDWKQWQDGKEVFSPYLTELLRKTNNDEFQAVSEWVRNNGELTLESGEVLRGPKPKDVAEGYKKSLNRLETIAKKLFPNRPLVIEATGHSWDIDV